LLRISPLCPHRFSISSLFCLCRLCSCWWTSLCCSRCVRQRGWHNGNSNRLQYVLDIFPVCLRCFFSWKLEVTFPLPEQFVVILCQPKEGCVVTVIETWNAGLVCFVVFVRLHMQSHSLFAIWSNTFHACMICHLTTNNTDLVSLVVDRHALLHMSVKGCKVTAKLVLVLGKRLTR